MHEDRTEKQDRWVIYAIIKNEVNFWDGFAWTDNLKRARIYNLEDAWKMKNARAKECFIDIHPWDRYAD